MRRTVPSKKAALWAAFQAFVHLPRKVDRRSVVFGTNLKHLRLDLLGGSFDLLHDLADTGASGFVATLGLVDVFINRFPRRRRLS